MVGSLGVVDMVSSVVSRAGPNAEIMIDVPDLDAVTRVRRFGTYGLNRTWDQMDSHGPALNLPMYGGRYQRRPGSAS